MQIYSLILLSIYNALLKRNILLSQASSRNLKSLSNALLIKVFSDFYGWQIEVSKCAKKRKSWELLNCTRSQVGLTCSVSFLLLHRKMWKMNVRSCICAESSVWELWLQEKWVKFGKQTWTAGAGTRSHQVTARWHQIPEGRIPALDASSEAVDAAELLPFQLLPTNQISELCSELPAVPALLLLARRDLSRGVQNNPHSTEGLPGTQVSSASRFGAKGFRIWEHLEPLPGIQTAAA